MVGRLNEAQQEALIAFLEENAGIAQGTLNKTVKDRLETKQKWYKISKTLNHLGPPVKNPKAWSKYWADKKWAMKKNVQQKMSVLHNVELAENEIDFAKMFDFSQNELRLFYAMGGVESLKSPLQNELHETHYEYPLPVEGEMEMLQEDDKFEGPSSAKHQRIDGKTEILNMNQMNKNAINKKAEETDRLYKVEEQLLLIESEKVTTLKENAIQMAKCAESLDEMAVALREGTSQIADAIRNAGQAIADALVKR